MSYLQPQTCSYPTSSFGTMGYQKFRGNLLHCRFLPITLLFINRNVPNLKHIIYRRKVDINGVNFTVIEQRIHPCKATKFANFAIFGPETSKTINVKFGTTTIPFVIPVFTLILQMSRPRGAKNLKMTTRVTKCNTGLLMQIIMMMIIIITTSQ